MICHEVHLQLSAFLEKSLDAIRMKSIETHLNSCPACRAEADDLSDCIRQVTQLPMVEPPPGFARRVMAHAREIEIEPCGWRRYTLRLVPTMPISAAATVILAVLAVFLYRSEHPVSSDGRSAVTSPLEGDPQRVTPVAQRRVPLEPSSAPTQRAPAVAKGVEHASAKPAPGTHSTKAQVVARVAAEDEKPSDNRLAPIRRPRIQAQEVTTGSPAFRPSLEGYGFGAPVGALGQVPFRRPPFPGAEQGFSPLSEPSPDIELIVRRRAWQRQAQVDETRDESRRKRSEAETAVSSAAAPRAVPAPGVQLNSIVEIRWFGVPADLYGQFRDQLVAEAHIDSEREISGIDRETASSQELLVKVIILPSDR